jgi:hypothetical protein
MRITLAEYFMMIRRAQQKPRRRNVRFKRLHVKPTPQEEKTAAILRLIERVEKQEIQ